MIGRRMASWLPPSFCPTTRTVVTNPVSDTYPDHMALPTSGISGLQVPAQWSLRYGTAGAAAAALAVLPALASWSLARRACARGRRALFPRIDLRGSADDPDIVHRHLVIANSGVASAVPPLSVDHELEFVGARRDGRHDGPHTTALVVHLDYSRKQKKWARGPRGAESQAGEGK